MSETANVGGSEAADSKDLASFGYKQELRRSLGVFSSFAAAFSYISPSTGIFTLFASGLIFAGGVFFWSWPIVALGQFIVALNFAEVSSHYPVAGSVFQWTKYLSPKSYAWFTGWIYIFAGILTVSAVVATLPIALLPLINNIFNTNLGSLHDSIICAVITLVVITVLNIYSVKLVSIVNNTGVFFEIAGMVIFAIVMMIVHRHQSLKIVTQTGGLHVGFSGFTAAMFMSLFVIYGFDTASTLAEETKDPRRAAPKAVLSSVVGAFIIGGIFILAMLMAIPNLHTAITGNNGAGWTPINIIDANFSKPWATMYFFIVSAAILVCCMCIMTATIRLCFGMARDQRLPGSKALSRVHPSLHTPIWSCIVIAVLAAVPFLKFAGVAYIAVGATAMIYLSYFLGNAAILRARIRSGWPKVKSPFSLGRWGTAVNVLALVYGGSMLVNFFWPRPAGNPQPSQVSLNFGLNFINKTPLLYSTLVVILVIGVIYYWAVESRRPLPVNVPAEEGPFVIPAESLPPDEIPAD